MEDAPRQAQGQLWEKEEEVDVDTAEVHLEAHRLGWESKRLQVAWEKKRLEGKEAVGVHYTAQAAPGQESDTGTKTC